VDDIKKRDLRAELLAAEAEARNKKRKAEGKPPLEEDVRRAAAIEAPKEGTPAAEDDEANKRRKLLQEALEMDKDDDDDDEEEKNDGDGDERYAPEVIRWPCISDFQIHSEEDSEEEDDTAELLRELDKIKRERAEEKSKQEAQQNAQQAADNEAHIATANPLLNLAAALGQDSTGINTTAPGTFSVKRRWDDGQLYCPSCPVTLELTSIKT
jgi:protein CWC15